MRSLISLVLMPLSLIVLLLGVGLILIWRGRRRAGSALCAVAACALYLLSTPAVASVVMDSLRVADKAPAAGTEPQMIVVLAGGYTAGGAGRPSELYGVTLQRIAAGREAYVRRGGTTPLLYIGTIGPPGPGALSEGELARRSWLSSGVHPDHIVVEESSSNTYESAVETAKILQARFGARERFVVILVTSEWHLARSSAVFARLGVLVLPVPCDFRRATVAGVRRVLPHAASLETSTTGIREWIGLFEYRVRGRL